jgi:hypothetical protein
MKKGVSVRISSLDIKYRTTNRNAYILKHNLRVTTAGPDGRFCALKGRRITLETEFSPEKLSRGEKLRKKKMFPVE